MAKSRSGRSYVDDHRRYPSSRSYSEPIGTPNRGSTPRRSTSSRTAVVRTARARASSVNASRKSANPSTPITYSPNVGPASSPVSSIRSHRASLIVSAWDDRADDQSDGELKRRLVPPATREPRSQLDSVTVTAIGSAENVTNQLPEAQLPPTIREVADRAGVSVSTVSRVLNQYPFVSDDARARVLAAMATLDYRPDVAAQSMRTGTSRAVGFVVADISNPLFATIAKGVDAVLYSRGYSLVLANSQNDPQHEAELISTLRQRRVDGLIAAVADERAPSLAERLDGFSTVLFDREVEGASADSVCSDHEQGLVEALERLASLGHRRVALIAGNQGQLGSRARVLAYHSHAARQGLDLDPALLRTVEPSRVSGYDVAQSLAALDYPPTAVIVAHNQITVGVLEAFRDLGISIPGEISIVACDDVDVTRLHTPPIDVVSRDLLELGRAAGTLLLERLADRDAPPRRIVLPTQLVVRASTAPPQAVARI
jgi:LacI family transcriptional regulator, galactose operon repressor